jgi:hypothetical protein
MGYVVFPLKNHEEYLELLEKLERRTKYIEVVTPYSDGSKDDFIINMQEYITEKRRVTSWWGTTTRGRSSSLFKIRADNEVFNYLKKYSVFCLTESDGRGFRIKLTDFGDKDIAFYDSKKKLLFCTTTHEGYLVLREDLK